MASSLTAACRASARLAGRRAGAARGLATSAPCLAAHNFTMPALSPTMTEGNIAAWKVKDGQAFAAGDVLLEIETDKATMDVEAQDDGVMMKILSRDGAKAVQVGSRIAVVADAGDDVASLDMPADESPRQQQHAPGEPESAAPPAGRSEPEPARPRPAPSTDGKRHQQKHPLMPAVEHLVKQHGLGADDVASIAPTGPGGRLLKGDVLAFLGTIDADAPSTVSSLLERLSHLDLSNVKVAPSKPAPAKGAGSPGGRAAPAPQPLRINVPVSLAKTVEVQRKIQDSLGVFLPLSTFISRAAEVANDHLPRASREPSSAELFDQVLGLDKVKATGSRGSYQPQISAIPPASMLASSPQPRRKKTDIFDELAGSGSRKPAPKKAAPPTVPGLSSGANVFTLFVPREEEKRAQVFLERCKLILEEEPGRLVL